MPTITLEGLKRSVQNIMAIDDMATRKKMRVGSIILEGDIKAKILGFDDRTCKIRYGKFKSEVALDRRFMSFKYVKEKSHAVTE